MFSIQGGFNRYPQLLYYVPSKYMLLSGTRYGGTTYSNVPDNTIYSATRYSVITIREEKIANPVPLPPKTRMN